MAVPRAIREGREVTPGGIRCALTAQGVPEEQAQGEALVILTEAREIVRRGEAQP
jgi:hypothetical protein